MRICLIAAEVSPFAKTGGLGDVCAALARHLARRGHDLRLFFPYYARIERSPSFPPVDFLRQVPLQMGGWSGRFTIHTTRLPGTEHAIYLVDCRELYDRPGIYTADADEGRRFAFLCRAALESCQRMGWAPEILHCNDWHTALAPLYVKAVYDWDRLFARTRSLLTIHNIAYQGVFGRRVLGDLGLEDKTDRFWGEDLDADRVNFLKTGIVYADGLSTVSPTHSWEIQTPEHGRGLDPLLRGRGERLVGILNGVDYEDWDPASDRFLPFHFHRGDLAGKEENKKALLGELQLSYAPGAPLAGVVSRLTSQKGIDLMLEVLPEALSRTDLRLVALGSGEPRYEVFFGELQGRFPDRVCFYRGFHEGLAHRIEAASDLFLMPSLFEPCGLNQMYSLRYGTVPVVRRTGGLADSVEPFDRGADRGTGFVFEHYTPEGLRWALGQALVAYRDRDAWRRLMLRGMEKDFSWERQIGLYEELYRRLAAQG